VVHRQHGVTGKATATYDLHPDMSTQSFAVRALRLALQQNTLLEGLVQLAVKLSYSNDRWSSRSRDQQRPSLEFPESIGFMGAIAAARPPGAETPGQDELLPSTSPWATRSCSISA